MGEPERKTILLVEDEAIISFATTRTLERHGFSVVAAASGEAAVEIAMTREEIELILMDVDLGAGMDGTQAAEAILQERDLPLVFLSSHTEPAVVDRTERITSYGYIVKNTGDTVLLASIRMAFRLWESEQRFRTAFESVQVGMVLTSPQGVLLRVNEAFASMLGYSRHKITAAEFATLTHPEDIGPSILTMQAMLRGDTDRTRFSKRFLHHNGQVVWADISTILLRNSTGEPLHFVTHVRDITQEVESMNALLETRNRLASVLSAVPTGIGVVQGPERAIVEANENLCAMTGYARDELLGQGARMLYPTQEDYEYVGREKYRQIAEHGVGTVEARWQRHDGTIIEVLLSSARSIRQTIWQE